MLLTCKARTNPSARVEHANEFNEIYKNWQSEVLGRAVEIVPKWHINTGVRQERAGYSGVAQITVQGAPANAEDFRRPTLVAADPGQHVLDIATLQRL